MEKTIQEQIESVINKKSTIAIHTISGRNAVEDATSILWNGLEQSDRTLGGLPGNFDIINNTSKILPNVYANDINNNKIVVVVSIPEVIRDENGEDWYMGIYPTGCEKYDKDADTLPINQFIESESRVPREFIAGLLILNEGHTSDLDGVKLVSGHVEKFVPNSKFIGALPQEEQSAFFETIKDKLIKNGLKKVTDNSESFGSLASYLSFSTYYQDELANYQSTTSANRATRK